MMDMGISGKTALITGGGRGIGRAICLALAAEGANIAINYIGGSEEAEETAAECAALGVRVMTVEADVACAEAVEAMFDKVEKELGGVDILVNNAGITRDTLLVRMTDEDFDKVISVNLRGVYLCMRRAARGMMKRRFGRIISLSSVVGLRGNAGQVNYAAAKAGIIGMTKSLARELASRGVTVNALAPGYIETAMTAAIPEAAQAKMLADIPAARAGQPEDVAAAAVFLASAQAGYITGHVLNIDGGMAM